MCALQVTRHPLLACPVAVERLYGVPRYSFPMLNILLIGDIVGSSGRAAVAKVLPSWKAAHNVHFVIANAENVAHGKGVTRETLDEVFACGVDAATSGNHIWAFPEAHDILRDKTVPLLRPGNFSDKLPGKGYRVFNAGTRRILVANFMGQAAMHQHLNSPFEAADKMLSDFGLPGSDADESVHAIVIDWHCELTSEKKALGWYLDGRVSAVLGTHTHVPTCDERILPKGTAYQSDVGMAGSLNSILGVEVEENLKRFTLQITSRLPVAERSPAEVSATLVAVNPSTGLAERVERLHEIVDIQ